MKKTTLIFLFLFVSISTLFAQQEPSESIIRKGISLYGQGRYKEAISTYKMVHENDSNYTMMLAELAMTYLQTEQPDSAIYYANLGLSLDNKQRQHLMRTKGTAFDIANKPDSAISVYKKAIERYPYSHLLHFNLGITYLKNNDFPNSALCFQEAIRCNPLHASSHLQLGRLAARQGLLSKALLSLQTFIAIEPSSKRSNEALVLVENISSGNYDESLGEPIIPFMSNEIFENTDHLIRSKVVLNSRFKPAIKFDANLVKQTALLLETIPFETTSNDFWVQMYFPIFKAFKDNNLIVPFLNTMLISTSDKNVVKYHKKKKKELNAFYAMGRHLTNIASMKPYVVNGETLMLSADFGEDYSLLSLGNTNEKGEEYGYWVYFYPNGEKVAEGYKSNGLKEGLWTTYYETGKVDVMEHYVAGKLEGTHHAFHPNGKTSAIALFSNDLLKDTVIWFDIFGNRRQVLQFKDSEPEGEARRYYSNGKLRESFFIKDGNLHNDYLSYYPNGALAEKTTYKEGNKEGFYQLFYSNGILKEEGSFENDLKEGVWNEYFPNSRLKTSREYSKDKAIGTHREYDHKGTLLMEKPYNSDGQEHGVASYFNSSGEKLVEEEYKMGTIVRLSSGFAAGKEPHTFQNANGTFSFETYCPKGKLRTKGRFVNGLLSGTFEKYHTNGNLLQKIPYDKGLFNGVVTSYYYNGKESYSQVFKQGYPNGQVKYFLQDGTLLSDGFFNLGDENGYYKSFRYNGALESLRYFENGENIGWNTYYAVDGKVYSRYYIENDLIVRQVNFGPGGEVIFDFDFLENPNFKGKYHTEITAVQGKMTGGKLDGELVWFHENGKLSNKTNYLDGKKVGTFASFYPNGMPKLKGEYFEDNKHGTWMGYSESGKLSYTETYFLGEKDSLHFQYHENGNIRFIESYYKDELHGETKIYNQKGTLAIIIHYDEGEIIGYQYYEGDKLVDIIPFTQADQKIVAYYPNGTVSYEREFKDFLAHGLQITYNEQGGLEQKRSFKNGLIDGLCELFYPNGNLKFQYTCQNNMFEGDYTTYYESGALKEVTAYLHDLKHGEARYYDPSGKLVKKEIYWNNDLISTSNE